MTVKKTNFYTLEEVGNRMFKLIVDGDILTNDTYNEILTKNAKEIINENKIDVFDFTKEHSKKEYVEDTWIKMTYEELVKSIAISTMSKYIVENINKHCEDEFGYGNIEVLIGTFETCSKCGNRFSTEIEDYMNLENGGFICQDCIDNMTETEITLFVGYEKKIDEYKLMKESESSMYFLVKSENNMDLVVLSDTLKEVNVIQTIEYDGNFDEFVSFLAKLQ